MVAYTGHGFRSQLPPGWVDRSTITLLGPTAEDGFGANIVVTRQPLPLGTSPTDFGEAQVAGLEREVEEVRVQDQRSASFRGRALFQRLHLLRVGDRWVQQVQTYLVVERGAAAEGFVITGSASPTAFDEVMPMFKQFVEAFEPTELGGA